MKKILALSFTVIFFCSFFTNVSSQVLEAYFDRLYPVQPNIRLGGMAVAIAVNPANDNEVIVASQTGGLMKTTNRASSWRTLFNLPPHWITDVEYAPMNTNNVIATAADDFFAAERGGIWLSRNGGENWEKVRFPSFALPTGTRVQATSIATFPGSRRILVGTTIGVAISDDDGVTWRNSIVPGGTVGAVALMRNNEMLASTSAGIFFWSSTSTGWTRERTGIGMAFGYNAFHVPKQFLTDVTTRNPVFVVNAATRILMSLDGGQNWAFVDTLPSPLSGSAKGTLFVRIAKPGYGDGVDLYVTNRYGVYRKFCPKTGPNFSYRFNERWQGILGMAHSDISDLSLDRNGNPYLLAGDGGIQNFWRDVFGDNFSFDNGGYSQNGFHALQITEVNGVYVFSRNNYDMYFGTQDNHLYASENQGRDWINPYCCEGFYIEVPRVVATEDDADVAFVKCSGCGNQLGRRLLRDVQAVRAATPATSSLKSIAPNKFLSYSFYKDTNRAARTSGTETGTEFYLTQNYSAPDRTPSWTRVADLTNLVPRSMPLRSGTGTNSVFYQAYKAYSDAGDDVGGPAGASIQRVKLMRLRLDADSYSGGGSYFYSEPRYPAMRNFGSIGVFPTEFAWYEVFAVDPLNPQHVIAADALNNRMMQSINGGDDWVEMPDLTRLITDNGNIRFKVGRMTQVSRIAFHPDNPRLVLLGTRDNGIFYSWNNGENWARIRESERIPEVSSFYFQNSSVWVSSYGRGLWKLEFAYRAPRVRIVDLCSYATCYTLLQPNILTSAAISSSQQFTGGMMIADGSIEGMIIVDGRVDRIWLSPAATVINYSDDKQLQLPFKVLRVDSLFKPVFTGLKGLDELAVKGYVIKGILLNGDKVVDIVYGKEQTKFPVEMKETQYVEAGSKELDEAGKAIFTIQSGTMINGNCYVAPGAEVTLKGRNFKPGLTYAPRVFIDGAPANFKLPDVKQDGSFELKLKLELPLGYHVITVEQQLEDKKRIIQTDDFIVMHEDKPMEKGQK